MEWLSLAFMQRALLAALITGAIAPAIGTFLVQRRLSLLGDGLGHLAVAGVGLALPHGDSATADGHCDLRARLHRNRDPARVRTGQR